MLSDPKRPITFPEQVRENLRAHTALAMMLEGCAGRAEWQDLADVVNIVEALNEMGKFDEVTMHWVRKSIDELVLLIKAPEGAMGIDPSQAIAFKRSLYFYDLAITRFSRGTLDEARRRVIAKIELARVAPDVGVTVVQL